jgi:hypothetical protein
MPQACPRGWHGARRARFEIVDHWVGAEFQGHKPPAIVSNTPIVE